MRPVPDPIATTPTGIMRKTMMKRIGIRTASLVGTRKRKLPGVFALVASGIVIAVSVISVSILTVGFGGSAAADDSSSAKVAAIAPVSLAGRWTGRYYGYGRP